MTKEKMLFSHERYILLSSPTVAWFYVIILTQRGSLFIYLYVAEKGASFPTHPIKL